MKRKALWGWLASALVAGAPGLAVGPPATGIWDGSVTQPNGTVEPVSFQVSEEQGELRLTMAEGGGRVSFSDVHVDEDDQLVFSWKSGEAVLDCVLEPQADGGYEGSCGDLRLAMSPPEE